MSIKVPVIAAIPNYNMASQLQNLLPQLIAEKYDAIYVLDDASTDDSLAVANSFSPHVITAPSKVNLGAGGNRNRILSAVKEQAIIHFIDADTVLETKGAPNIARALLQAQGLGFVGGLVRNKDGTQMMWNFGPRISLYATWTSLLQYYIAPRTTSNKWLSRLLHRLTRRLLCEWPDVAQPLERTPAFWVAEANMLIWRDTLAKLGGFDDNIRENDVFEPALQAYKQGLITLFDPSIAVRHLEVSVRGYNRELARRKAIRYLVRKHGHRSWLLPDGHFKPRVNKP